MNGFGPMGDAPLAAIKDPSSGGGTTTPLLAAVASGGGDGGLKAGILSGGRM